MSAWKSKKNGNQENKMIWFFLFSEEWNFFYGPGSQDIFQNDYIHCTNETRAQLTKQVLSSVLQNEVFVDLDLKITGITPESKQYVDQHSFVTDLGFEIIQSYTDFKIKCNGFSYSSSFQCNNQQVKMYTENNDVILEFGQMIRLQKYEFNNTKRTRMFDEKHAITVDEKFISIRSQSSSKGVYLYDLPHYSLVRIN